MIRFEQILNAFRKIFCECHRCKHIFRLSEIEIHGAETQPKDWLSQIDEKIRNLENKIERAEELFSQKRALIVERERKNIERETYKKINRLVPNFSSVRFNTRDVKAVGFPIKFISFDGKDEGWVKKIRLIDFHPETSSQERMLVSIAGAIKKGNLEWKTLRITDEGQVEEE